MMGIKQRSVWALPILGLAFILTLFVFVRPTSALTPIPTPDPKPGSFGIEATKRKPPPTTGASITIPGNGGSFTTSPIDVRGICPTGLLVQVFNNGVMVGSVMCTNGSFSLQVTLFAGVNELTAIVYDELDQAGPTSASVTVNYNDSRLTAFGALITLTSSYGRRSAPAGNILSWPLQLSGGAGPYAFSIDWGDDGAPELKSQPLAGVVTINHTYKKAGIYQVNIKVTDVNGVSAFLQVIAVASGKVDGTATATTDDKDKTPNERVTILWVPAAVSLALLAPAYWLGRRSQIVSLRNKMLKERNSMKE